MNIIKRNLPFVIFCLIAVVAIITLLFLLARHSTKAQELEEKVEEQKRFFQEIRRKDYAVTEESVDAIQENSELAKEKLVELRRKLSETSQIEVEQVDGLEAKNLLKDEVDRLVEELDEAGVIIDDEAAGLSFSAILEGDELPDEETEVPVILKQLRVIEEVARILAESSVDELNTFSRPFGLGVDEREFFSIMPLELSVAGDAKSVRQFVSGLQQDAELFFFIDNIELQTSNTADNLIKDADQRDRDDSRRDRRRRSDADGEQEDEDEEKTSKKTRRIPFNDMVECSLQISFVDFYAPDTGK